MQYEHGIDESGLWAIFFVFIDETDRQTVQD